MMFALVAIIPVSAQFMNPDVDDVLDNPSEYVNKEIVVESEVDRVLSDNAFVLEDDADVFGEDHLLVISVSPDRTVNNLDDESEVSISSLKEGKIAQVSGQIRMFNRAELEREFGTLNLGTIDEYNFDESQPVLVMGAREHAAAALVIEEEITEVPSTTDEEVYTEPSMDDSDMEPMETEPVEPVEPEIDQDTDVDADIDADVDTDVDQDTGTMGTTDDSERLPATATGLPAVGLIGMLSMALGFAIRLFR